MRIILLFIIFSLTGCYPVYKTLQPQIEIVVLDSEKRPVQGAEVNLISKSRPHDVERSREIHITDSEGVAKFQQRNDWRIESPIMIHGQQFYYWDWCIEKDGFITYINGDGEGKYPDYNPDINPNYAPSETIKIELKRGESKVNCLTRQSRGTGR